jgi:hypothetical protein
MAHSRTGAASEASQQGGIRIDLILEPGPDRVETPSLQFARHAAHIMLVLVEQSNKLRSLLQAEYDTSAPMRIHRAHGVANENQSVDGTFPSELPSQLKQPRTYRSRPNPFADDWPWIANLLKDDPALQGQTLFGLLCDRQPGRYQAGQLRTLQRHIAAWRAQYGPNREVMFPQVHEPGEAAQSDFTAMNSPGVTLGGVPFQHMVYHLVLVYSNIEAVQICFSESFESLVEGFETCLWRIGGSPRKFGVFGLEPHFQRTKTNACDGYVATLTTRGSTT